MAEIVASRIDGESIVSAAFRAWAGPFVRASFPKSSIEPLRGQQNVDSTRGHLQALARDSASNFLTYALIEAWVARDIAPLPTTSISPPFTSSQYLEFPQATIRFASACLRRRVRYPRSRLKIAPTWMRANASVRGEQVSGHRGHFKSERSSSPVSAPRTAQIGAGFSGPPFIRVL